MPAFIVIAMYNTEQLCLAVHSVSLSDLLPVLP